MSVMREGHKWLMLAVLPSILCGALLLEGATEDKNVPTVLATADAAASSASHQQTTVERTVAASSPSESATSGTVSLPSVQIRVRATTPQQSLSSPSSPTSSQQQQQVAPEPPQPQTFFRRLHPRPGQNLIPPAQNPQPVLAVPEAATPSRPVPASLPSTVGTSSRQAAQSQKGQQQQQSAPLQTHIHVTSPKLTAATVPAQPTVPHRAPPRTIIPRVRNGNRTQRRRKIIRRPHHRHMTTRTIPRRFRSRVSGTRTIWPAGDYCIMPGSSGACPAGFAAGSVSFAVPVSVKSHEMYREGESFRRYVELGKIGGFDIGSKNFDNIYKIALTACCRVKTA